MKCHQIIIILTSLLITACVDNGYKPVALDSNYGYSVKQITQAQFLNPKAAANPSRQVSKRMDGIVGQNIIKTYRNSFGQTQAQPVQPVNINVGGNTNMNSSGN
jgi:hypothetical protein